VTAGLYHQRSAFPYRAVVSVPEGQRVLSAGKLVAERSSGGRTEFEYESDGKIYFYPIMAGTWVENRRGPNAVYHAAVHPQNRDKILDALERSRNEFSAAFAPYPYSELRVVEFPRHASFAMGYPTLIPYSESIGFLTRDPEDAPNLNFYVTGHEVAHQWWGTVVWPAHGKGSPVLTEGLANYATLVLAERVEGDARRRKLFTLFEDLYLRRRDPNEERPISELDGDRRGDDAIWYNRGGVVFYMLHRMLGEQRMLAGIQEYVRRYSFQDDHPTIHDFVDVFEDLYPETGTFFDQYVFAKSIPNPKFVNAKKESLGDGRWRVRFDVANRGEGDLELVIEAHEGKRADRDKAEKEARKAGRSRDDRRKDPAERESLTTTGEASPEAVAAAEPFASSRAVVSLVGEDPVAGEIVCDFEPTELEMDPDGTVLLQERLKGRHDL
jgi:aminopeptidase N